MTKRANYRRQEAEASLARIHEFAQKADSSGAKVDEDKKVVLNMIDDCFFQIECLKEAERLLRRRLEELEKR